MSKEVRPVAPRRHCFRPIAVGLLVLLLGFFAWTGWRAYDHRAAIREARSLGWEWEGDEPFDEIRKDWRSAFQRITWQKESDLAIGPGKDVATHLSLIGRLNPVRLTVAQPANCPPLPTLPRLKILMIQSVEALPNLDGLKNLPSLEMLYLDDIPRLQDIRALSDLPKLRLLKIKSCPLLSQQSIRDLPALECLVFSQFTFESAKLKGLPKLWSVVIYDCPNLRNLDTFTELATLRQFHIRGCPSLQEIEGLSGLKNLERITVMNCPSLKKFDTLEKLPGLEELTLNRCPHFSEEYWRELASKRPGTRIVVDDRYQPGADPAGTPAP